jgi:hypothetical protein
MDERPEALFVIRADYFANNRVEDEIERDGIKMTFRGWTYSLQDYAEALESASLLIEAMREPRPSGDEPAYRRWNRVPDVSPGKSGEAAGTRRLIPQRGGLGARAAGPQAEKAEQFWLDSGPGMAPEIVPRHCSTAWRVKRATAMSPRQPGDDSREPGRTEPSGQGPASGTP